MHRREQENERDREVWNREKDVALCVLLWLLCCTLIHCPNHLLYIKSQAAYLILTAEVFWIFKKVSGSYIVLYCLQLTSNYSSEQLTEALELVRDLSDFVDFNSKFDAGGPSDL